MKNFSNPHEVLNLVHTTYEFFFFCCMKLIKFISSSCLNLDMYQKNYEIANYIFYPVSQWKLAEIKYICNLFKI